MSAQNIQSQIVSVDLPQVAIVGRPNVGKSTLLNRFVGQRLSIVDPTAGVTRDVTSHLVNWNGCDFMALDTGGYALKVDDSFAESINRGVINAIKNSQLVIFMVDGMVNITQQDEDIAKVLKRQNVPVLLVSNKADSKGVTNDRGELAPEVQAEYQKLGLGAPLGIAAASGLNCAELLDEVVRRINPNAKMDSRLRGNDMKKLSECDIVSENVGASCARPHDSDDSTISVAILGKPNAGKSSLVNALLGQERSIVSEVAGTTRDSVDTEVQLTDSDGNTHSICLIDTAGLRRKSKITEGIEYYSLVRAEQSLNMADVVVLVIDAEVGLSDQDQRIARLAADNHKALVIVLNKSDLLDEVSRIKMLELVHDRLVFIDYAEKMLVSALKNKNTLNVWPAVLKAYTNYSTHISTSKLNKLLMDIKLDGPNILKGRKRLQIKYITQVASQPPRFVLFCNHPDIVPHNYYRYIENQIRANFELASSPIVVEFREK